MVETIWRQRPRLYGVGVTEMERRRVRAGDKRERESKRKREREREIRTVMHSLPVPSHIIG